MINSGINNILDNEKTILLVLDNAKIHHADDVKVACEILNIELIYLLEYSTDLNHIEDLWKIIKSVTYSSDYNDLGD